MKTENGKKLMGVKAIAAFLNVDERTVRRWCGDPNRGAPVRKVAGRYFAFETDLTKWAQLVDA